MKLVVDTQEQLPFTFERFGVHVDRAALSTGDYSLPGFEDRVAIERKSLDDLVGCLKGAGRERFERELQRGRSYELFRVVVEAILGDIRRGRYRSEMKPDSVIQSVVAFEIRHGAPFVWCGDRAAAEYMTFSFLSKYLYEIEKRFEMAGRRQGANAPELPDGNALPPRTRKERHDEHR